MVETVEADGNDVINPCIMQSKEDYLQFKRQWRLTESSLARNSQYAQVVTRTSLIDLCIDLILIFRKASLPMCTIRITASITVFQTVGEGASPSWCFQTHTANLC